MSHGSVWQRSTLAVEQVPTLRKLLRCCDEALLVRTIIEDHALGAMGAQPLTAKRRRAAEKRLSATLATMRGLPLGAKESPPLVLLPEESFVLHARTGSIERRLGALLLSFGDEARVRRIVETLGAEGSRACDAPDEEDALRRSFTLASWEDVLAYRVWLGGPWCTRERYLVLASAFWEMTYLGFEYDRVCARQAQEKAGRMLEGKTREGENAPPPSPRVRAISAEGRARKAAAYGLDEPDRFALDYRDRLAVRVGELNRSCRRDALLRFLDLLRRIEGS